LSFSFSVLASEFEFAIALDEDLEVAAHMPVLMGPERLLAAVSLARSLGIPALQEPGGLRTQSVLERETVLDTGLLNAG
jgi:hypothetical protein